MHVEMDRIVAGMSGRSRLRGLDVDKIWVLRRMEFGFL